MNEEKVTFLSEGVKIAGLFAAPGNGQPRKNPCVILAHGYINSKDEFGGFSEISHILVKKNCCVFRFDFRGCGESGGLYGRMLCSTEWLQDILSAVSFVLTRSEVDPQRIALVGQSLGGSTVSYISAFDERVKTIIAMASVADGKKWLEELWVARHGQEAWQKFIERIQTDRQQRVLTGESEILSVARLLARNSHEEKQMAEWHEKFPYYQLDASLESIESVINLRPIDVISRCLCPILFIHGEKDLLVPNGHSRMLYERVESEKSLETIEGAGHDLPIGSQKRAVQKIILDWCDKWL